MPTVQGLSVFKQNRTQNQILVRTISGVTIRSSKMTLVNEKIDFWHNGTSKAYICYISQMVL